MADAGTADGSIGAAATNQSSSQRNNRRNGQRNGGESGGDVANGNREAGRGGRSRGRGRGGGGRGGNRGGDSQPAHGEGNSNSNGGGGGGGDNSNRKTGGSGRGRGGHRGRGAQDDANCGASAEPRPSQKDPILRSTQTSSDPAAAGEGADADEDAEVCFICANPVIHHAIAPCNHLTCHICALRMRALYRTKDCPHCRTSAPYVIFTDDPSKRFEDYTPADITSTDDNIGIKYTSEDIVGDTVLLLRYNCPDDTCDYAGLGWPDLHRHVRSQHNKKMCDLCTRNKKVFTHEHDLFSDKGLETHMRQGNDKPGAKDQSGFRGHPLCGFCGERFYDDDKLYEHCRNKHERCFICDRRDSRQPHYFRNYNELEKHFRNDHFPCLDRECMEKKFVVFGSEMDLKAHQLTEHGNTLSKDVRRDVQVVSMADFNYRPAQSGRNNGGGGGGRQGRGRDPNADAPTPVPTSQNMRRDEIAFQRQLNIHSAQNVSNRTFGSHLSTPTPTPVEAGSSRQNNRNQNNQRNNNNGSSAAGSSSLVNPMETLSVQDMSQMTPQDRARAVRHGAVIERASNMLGSNPAKIAKFRSHISSYRQGTWTATQLIDAFSALFSDTSDTALGSLVREVADLFEDPSQADALRRALSDRRAVNDSNSEVNEDYPSLPTLGGMHGATTATSGWAAAASSSAAEMPNAQSAHRNSSTRVLRLKHSTRLGGPSTTTASLAAAPRSNVGPAGRAVPGATWTAPPSARPAVLSSASLSSASSAAFPALPSVATKKSSGAGSSWSSAGGGPSTSLAARVGGASVSSTPKPSSYAAPATSSSAGARRPPPGIDNFPALPAASKPPPPAVFSYGRRTVRRDLGGNEDTGFSWNSAGRTSETTADNAPEDETPAKGKKKGKKVLVQWG